MVINLLSYTCLFIGYVTGSLWKVRHVLHFWWSTGVSLVAHLALCPIYIHLISLQSLAKNAAGQKLYMYLMVGLTCFEVVMCITISKRVGLWIRQRSGRFIPAHHNSGPGSLLT